MGDVRAKTLGLWVKDCIFIQFKTQRRCAGTKAKADPHPYPCFQMTASLALFKHPVVAALVVLATVSMATANELHGHVVGVSDGDSITVLDAERTQHKIRLASIDAPERGQPFGDASKRSLSALVFKKGVVVEWHKADRYGRLVGVVRVQPSGKDAGLAQVSDGMAWHYAAYEREQSVDESKAYRSAEHNARLAGIGLWREADPTAPWDYRSAKRAGQRAGAPSTPQSED
jgi:endonuclease YncB( thermonuclease family)